MDAAYSARYLSIARMLWQASEGDPSRIPLDYAEHLNHSFVDGDISLGSLLPLVEDYSEMEDEEIEEAIEMLGKVNPSDWPDLEHIESVSLSDFLRVYDEAPEDTEDYDFVEDNLSAAEKVEKCLIEVISSVFGDKVSTIRSEKGYFANPKNNFLQEDDGTFAGTFMYDGNKYLFEVAPVEDGWLCTYRMHWDALNALPPKHDEDREEVSDYTRRVRHRGWK